MDGWEWLSDLKGAVQTGENQEDAAAKRMREVITGRSVLSMPNKLGGFFSFTLWKGMQHWLCFSRVSSCYRRNLDHTIAVGTQIKIDIPGKGATVAFVDSIETPTVRLNNGNVVKIRDVKHGLEIKNDIEKNSPSWRYLISFGDFLRTMRI